MYANTGVADDRFDTNMLRRAEDRARIFLLDGHLPAPITHSVVNIDNRIALAIWRIEVKFFRTFFTVNKAKKSFKVQYLNNFD